MMIDAETYYAECLQGKTVPEMLAAIDDLKNEMEQPGYRLVPHTKPDGATRIMCMHEWLQRAIQAIYEAGAEYIPSAAEEKAAEFEKNIPYIRRFLFSMEESRPFYRETHIVTLTGSDMKHSVEYFPGPRPPVCLLIPEIDEDEAMDAEGVQNEIRRLFMGEWRETYDTERFGYGTLDGIRWEVEIEYSNGHRPVRFEGSNAYPYNFGRLMGFFGVNMDIY